MMANCANCGKEIDRKPCRIKERNYCGAKCQVTYEYSNGIRDKATITTRANEIVKQKYEEKFKTNPTICIGKRGYKEIYVPNIGKIKLHHYIWQQQKGEIPLGMCLHHINFDRLDNRIENLQLMIISEHHKLHYAKRIIDKYGRFVPT